MHYLNAPKRGVQFHWTNTHSLEFLEHTSLEAKCGGAMKLSSLIAVNRYVTPNFPSARNWSAYLFQGDLPMVKANRRAWIKEVHKMLAKKKILRVRKSSHRNFYTHPLKAIDVTHLIRVLDSMTPSHRLIMSDFKIVSKYITRVDLIVAPKNTMPIIAQSSAQSFFLVLVDLLDSSVLYTKHELSQLQPLNENPY